MAVVAHMPLCSMMIHDLNLMKRRDAHKYLSLLQKPRKPSFQESVLSSAKGARGFLGSPLLAFVIAILAFVVPNVEIRIMLQGLLILVALSALASVGVYIRQWYQYIAELEHRVTMLRSIVLTRAGVDETAVDDDLKYSISAIANRDGTVCLVIADTSGLRVGSLLDVVVTNTREIWGSIEVSEKLDNGTLARPLDRANPEFWESLEDRMNTDPSPPPGIHLEPTMPPDLRRIIEAVPQERK